MKKYFAEFVGTFILVLFGCGVAVITGGVPGLVGIVGIAFAFGLALIGAAWVLMVIAVGTAGYNLAANGLGQDGWGPGYQGEYNMQSAILFEVVATAIFVIVVLGSTQKSAPAGFAGLAIGITLVAIHLFGIHITGVSVNPARSLGPALFAGSHALSQVWLFLVFPSVGGAVAGLLFRTKLLAAD